MTATEEVVVDGESYTQRKCYIKALEYDPKNSRAWNNLSASMSPTDSIVVNGFSFTASDCRQQYIWSS